MRKYECNLYSLILNYLPKEIGAKLTMEAKLGLHLDNARQEIHAEMVDPLVAKTLDIRVGKALLSIERMSEPFIRMREVRSNMSAYSTEVIFTAIRLN